MSRLVMAFTCKDEAASVRRLLASALPAMDLMVVNDLGSRDGTKEVIRAFGIEHRIPVLLFERPFRLLASSKAFVLRQLQEALGRMGWDPANTWAMWTHPGEQVGFSGRFTKEDLDKDVLQVPLQAQGHSFHYKDVFRVSVPFDWYGPFLETPFWAPRELSFGTLPGISINIYMSALEQQLLADRYRQYAVIQATYVQQKDHAYKWIFLAGTSYRAAADYAVSDSEKRVLESQSIGYFEDLLGRRHVPLEYKEYAQLHLGIPSSTFYQIADKG